MLITTNFTVHLTSKYRQRSLRKIYKLLNRIHQDVTLGIFCHDYFPNDAEDRIRWSYRAVLSNDELCDVENIDLMIVQAMKEVDGLYPSFQMVLLSGVSVEKAYDSAIPEVYGHA